MKRLLVLTIATLVALGAWAGEYKTVSLKELKKSIAEKQVTLLDANGTDSWKEGHIPGAIDFERHENRIANVLPKDKNALVVAYCGGPKCTAYKAAAEAAKKLGYKNVKYFSGGISGWKEAGEKTESGT